MQPLSMDGTRLISVSFPVLQSKETQAHSLTKTFFVPMSKEEGLALRCIHHHCTEGNVANGDAQSSGLSIMSCERSKRFTSLGA